MSDLELNVIAVNLVNKNANEWYEKLVPIFTPLVGKKVVKKDGSLIESVKKLLPTLPNTPGISVYHSPSKYSLIFTVKVCVAKDNSCTYKKTTVYIGDITGDTLTQILKKYNHRSDYTVKEIEEAGKRLS